ncbi:SIR2 family protein [Methanolacinia paynteri]|uniref:SIR2 family protein n=1 Tax=Methanolacinia paynteri TaxID=230356 RepID=UPI00064F1851|nr:SIR2 family protein [Methanolacinia paynteri]
MLTPTLQTPNLETRIKSSKKPNIVVLGAGISKEFGYPLANELLNDICIHGDQDSQRIIDLNRFCSSFYNDFSPERLNYPDIEDFLGMVDVAEQYADIRFSKNRGYYWRSGKIEEIKFGIKKLISEYLWSFQKKIEGSDLSKISKMIDYFESNTIYITFNYDLLLETALSKFNYDYTYGISNNPEVLSILKPHGSINWFYKNRFKKHQPAEIIDYGNGLIIANTLNFTDIERCKGMDPVIISPTPSKKIEEHDMKKIWTGFSSSVHNAKSLYIIGYSLANADRLTRLVLKRAGPGHSNCKNIVAIRRTDHEEEYKKYISPYARQIKSSFGNWADEI